MAGAVWEYFSVAENLCKTRVRLSKFKADFLDSSSTLSLMIYVQMGWKIGIDEKGRQEESVE